MNRFVSLLAAFSVATVSLAQPAQAQWVRGMPYFLSSNTSSNTTGTSVTAVINNSQTGHLNITATPTSSISSTSGSYSGSVAVYYVWNGQNPTQSATLTSTVSLESSGTPGSIYGASGNSSAGGHYGTGGALASGNFSTYPSGWDQTASGSGVSYHYSAGATPASQNLAVPLGGSLSAYYYNNPGSSIVTADVTFSSPVVTP